MAIKAVSLFSGGLDSILAAKIIQNLGIEVEAIFFKIGFHNGDLEYPQRKRDQQVRYTPRYYAECSGVKLHEIDLFEDFKEVLINPKRGYGGNLNPCIDCKAFMMSRAKKWMAENDFDFMISGEVIGQRPMSQRKEVLPLVAKDAGITGLIVRPLSAKLLPATIPEESGWIKREDLYDFNGRGRKPQMALAAELGITEYPQPAGGCLLTEPDISRKMQDLWQSRGDKDYSKADVMLMNAGRHIRPSPDFKLIIARENSETQFLKRFRESHASAVIANHSGPITIVDGQIKSEADARLILAITARFGKGRDCEQVNGKITFADGSEQDYADIAPIADSEIKQEWYV
ncbi:MAG: tRNA (5-methylaminomethyl-2-thiouridylate)-methyltransferase [Gammaproteobacteria bacterium]|nr:MAG: tRNA (5-methylaminomethyl-2-thiouridylate)-methyltransferase [Gammaproteobacteria bacterium]